MSGRVPSIAHVITESTPFGGAQRNTLLSVKGLAREGYPVELICGAGGPLIDHARAAGVSVLVIPELLREVRPLADLQAFWRLCQLYRSRGYDIVHTHSTKAGLLGRLAAWLVGVPVIIHTVHGVPFRLDGGLPSRIHIVLEQLAARMTTRVLCVGEVLKAEVAKQGIAPQKLDTVYSGIEFDAYVPARTPEATRRQLGLENVWPVVGCIGRLSEQKAQDELVESIALLVARYPRVKLLLVGEGPLRPRLEAQIARLGLQWHVALLGERGDIADLFAIFDVYAMTSRWEGVGRALTEAAYHGLPIVATAVNGVPELIGHDETGLLVPPGDRSATAAALDRLAADRALAARLGAAARQRVCQLMDARAMVRRLEEIYLTTLARGCGATPRRRPSSAAAPETAASSSLAVAQPGRDSSRLPVRGQHSP